MAYDPDNSFQRGQNDPAGRPPTSFSFGSPSWYGAMGRKQAEHVGNTAAMGGVSSGNFWLILFAVICLIEATVTVYDEIAHHLWMAKGMSGVCFTNDGIEHNFDIPDSTYVRLVASDDMVNIIRYKESDTNDIFIALINKGSSLFKSDPDSVHYALQNQCHVRW